MVLVRSRPVARRRPTWPSTSLMREMESFLRDAGQWSGPRGERAFPAVNVTQDTDRFYLRAELPGMRSEDLDLSVDGNKITLRGRRDIPAESDDVSFHRRERVAGTFARTVALPADVSTSEVSATYRNGILTVVAPKAPEAKPRQIAVNAN